MTVYLLPQKPGNLAHPRTYRDLLALIFQTRAAGRIAGFQSSTFMCLLVGLPFLN